MDHRCKTYKRRYKKECKDIRRHENLKYRKELRGQKVVHIIYIGKSMQALTLLNNKRNNALWDFKKKGIHRLKIHKKTSFGGT